MDNQVNYQLLQDLKVLLEEQHITKASERLNISQPAMSLKLRKLRRTFGDELLVRTSLGMRRTSRAEELLAKITPLLIEVEELFTSKKTFNPDTYYGKFIIGTCDHFATILLSKLNQSPQFAKLDTKIQIIPLTITNVYEALSSGRVDIALGYNLKPQNNIMAQYLFTDTSVLLVDETSEFAIRGGISLEDFNEAKKICYSKKHKIEVIDVQQDIGANTSEDVLTTYSPFMFGSINLLRNTNKILVSTKAYYDLVCKQLSLVCFEPEWMANKSIEMNLYWYNQLHESPGNIWLREFLQRLFKQ